MNNPIGLNYGPDNYFVHYLSYGLSVIPVKDKVCLLQSWKSYQTALAHVKEAAAWPPSDIACVCGKVSGGLVCVDFDVKNGDRWEAWQCLISEKFPEILSKLVIETTPSGGYHVIFRSGLGVKNLKLACNKNKVATIETRGEGGYFVCAPSKNYALYFGSFDKICTLTDEEAEIVLSCAAALNEWHEPEKQERLPTGQTQGGLTPFDDYNSRNTPTDILIKHGWKESFSRGEAKYFQRPGKEGRGVSASWGAIPDRFYVFSTSTSFEHQHIYKASAVYTILEHGGDFSAAARELVAQGYGKKAEPVKTAIAKIIEPSNIKKEIADIYDNGYEQGTSTGWRLLDTYYRVIKGQFTVVTGMPSHGKSQFLDALMMNLAMRQGWKFGVFSPENYPTKIHYHQLIEKYVGKSLTSGNRMTLEEAYAAVDFINEHFFFIDATEDEINLDAILIQAQYLIDTKKIDGLSLDPWNEIEMDKPKDLSTTEYIGKSLRISRKFARRNSIHLWIAVHPIKMQKDKATGEYPIPELYDCEGSAMWRNKADNGICVHRDILKDETHVYIQKIKYRYTGKQGEVQMKFDQESGRYNDEF